MAPVRPFFLVATCKLLHIAGKRLECGDEELTKISDRTGSIGFDMEDEIEKRNDFNRKWLTFYMEVFTVLLEKHDMVKGKMGGSETTDANDSADGERCGIRTSSDICIARRCRASTI